MRYIKKLTDIPQLTEAERSALAPVVDAYAFRVSDYYLNLIDWKDPADPIRQLIIPRPDELHDWGKLDASNEAANTVMRGVQHKYPDTALLLCNEVCGAYCRYCFRKRLFMNDNDEASKDLSEGFAYIAAHPEITNVLLTGGDPLLLSTRRLTEIISALREIPHVQIIRIGTKMTAFNPFRVLDDPALIEMFEKYSTPQKRIYVMNHFDHPRELTDEAVACLDKLIRAGAIMTNQCPLIAGINDAPMVLSDMFRKLSWIGCPPYYVFQGRPTAGNDPYKVSIVRGWEIFREALRYGSGVARRARFVMSHETGKIEILAVDEKYIYLRYQRAKDASLRGRFLIYKRSDEAYWLDDLEPVEGLEGGVAPHFAHESKQDTVDGPE
ncbi:MAG: KamA family radical SAM protein [Rhodocyclaceae bacterium]|nr:KamA family radical SAM protein [Rhodocyclaceae bacterium]MDZ4215690.1 KamA family radical SAM protein [Rhodocyclaceae bacterium]